MGERHFALHGDRRILASDSGGDGLPVLFLNSLAANISMWEPVRTRLSRRSVAFDARGHGRSDVVPGDADLDALADDALAVMDEFGLERAVLCGLSLGGLTAMKLAGRAPQRVAGLVLSNTAATFPPAAMWAERSETARSGRFDTLVEPTLERWLTARFREAEPGAADGVRRMIASTPPEGYAAACAALASGDGAADLAAYRGPVLVIAGAHDLSTPVARAEELVAIAGQAELLVLDAAHLAAFERAEEFASALEALAARVEHDG